eukprot:103964-Pleurochrysis_carterae.AAC.3
MQSKRSRDSVVAQVWPFRTLCYGTLYFCAVLELSQARRSEHQGYTALSCRLCVSYVSEYFGDWRPCHISKRFVCASMNPNHCTPGRALSA